jgi:hypothetical protein
MRINLHSQILASTVLALAALATHPAMAQARLNVPFNFVAAGHTYPAGTYTVMQDKSMDVVALLGEGQSLAQIAGTEDNLNAAKVSLKFERVGNTYYLSTMQYGQLVTPRLDRKIKETVAGPELAVLMR